MAAQADKSRPIIFDGESVRAILDGRKTQTRRVVKPQPEPHAFGPDTEPAFVPPLTRPGYLAVGVARFNAGEYGPVRCPYGAPGDELWVRETWLELDRDHYDEPGPRGALSARYGTPRRNGAAYRAECNAESDRIRAEYGYRWRSPIHMPRWASRLALRVTDVRVERGQEIPEADAIAEGVTRRESGWSADWSRVGELSRYATASAVKGRDLAPLSERDISLGTARHAFGNRWDRINARRGFSWESNPWVWAVTFEANEAAVAAKGE